MQAESYIIYKYNNIVYNIYIIYKIRAQLKIFNIFDYTHIQVIEDLQLKAMVVFQFELKIFN